MVYDDARHFILTSKEKFDIITTDPIHPWVKGAASLYTKEYFEHVKRHLKPGGVVTQWVPLYETTLEAVKSEMATFFRGVSEGQSSGSTMAKAAAMWCCSARPIPRRSMSTTWWSGSIFADNTRAAEALREVGFESAIDLMSGFAGYGPDLAVWLKDAAINTDHNLRLQYLAGMGVNVDAKTKSILT